MLGPWSSAPGRPLARSRYLTYGAGLLALKLALDWLVLRAAGREFSLAFYVKPLAALGQLWTPWVQSNGKAPDRLPLAVLACAIPFLGAGLWLTLRRLRDAGLPSWLALFFFVPLAKFIFFVVCAVVPSAGRGTPAREVDDGPYRRTRIGGRPGAPRRPWVSSIVAAGGGAIVALGAIETSVWVFREYGLAMFWFSPAIASFTTTLLLHRLAPRPGVREVAGATLLATAISLVAIVAFALEGLVCMIMVLPLLAAAATLGAIFGHLVARSLPPPHLAAPTAGALALLPFTMLGERAAPIGDERALPVESVVVVDAPPDLVWKRVTSFPPLAPATEWLFRAGVAAPLAATIDGEGVGAVRRCQFTTGDFVEPIDTWVPDRELAFSVASEPDPLREWTVWSGPRPPHLDGYLRSRRGRFLLEPLPGGKTRLAGTTSYEMHMAPAWYWRIWGDAIIHAIHLRVLAHVARLAEADARAR